MSSRLLRDAGLSLAFASLIACSGADPDGMRTMVAPASTAETPPPVGSEALAAWLERGEYGRFTRESAVHASAGPHRFVRVFLNESLVASLHAGDAVHPIGAAAVKELYDQPGAGLTGWAVAVKTADNQVKEDWLWYERAKGSAAPSTNRNGQPICASCHEAGRDHILTEFPLR